MDERSDQQLLREYAARGSEEAFTTLVNRHTSLVYGTAFRKLTDASHAEEVTQAVFVILARKAPFLCHNENIAGWLHRAALLESQQSLRGELRRRRREEMASNMNDPANDSHLAQELDEVLLDLPEKDRQPLLLRFFESLSLREVAARLGIREDAAQKRVAKSLDLLERLLRRRGRNVSSVALAAALANAAQAAPAYLAAKVATAAVATGASATVVTLAFGKFMALTKIQTAIVCMLAVAAPLLLQRQHLEVARSEHRLATSALAQQQNRFTHYSETVRQLRSNLAVLELDREAALSNTARIAAAPQPAKPDPAALYRWSESSEYVRLPKTALKWIQLSAVKPLPPGADTNSTTRTVERIEPLSPNGLSEAFVEALGLTAAQQNAVIASVGHFAQQFEAVAAQHTVLTNTKPPGLSFTAHDKIYTLHTRAFPEQGEELKRRLISELETHIGVERTEVLFEQGHRQFAHDFLEFGARERWLAVAPDTNGTVTLAKGQSKGSMSLGGSVSTRLNPKFLPEQIRPHLPSSIFAKQ